MLRARASSPPAGWGSWCAATASSIGSFKSYSYFFSLLYRGWQLFSRFMWACVDLAFVPAVAAGGI